MGEEFEINKKMVKLAEIVIRKISHDYSLEKAEQSNTSTSE